MNLLKSKQAKRLPWGVHFLHSPGVLRSGKLISALFLAFFLFPLFTQGEEIKTCEDHDISGWAWSDNIGWISLSCRNLNEVGEGIDYGLDITDTILEGYAWSPNIGWIGFSNPPNFDNFYNGCPQGGENCDAKVDGLDVLGWAKVMSNGEWISLSGTSENGDPYGLSVNLPNLSGYAWGGTIVGWITFSDGILEDDGNGGFPGDPDPNGTGGYISLIGSDFPIDEFNNITFSAWIYWKGLGGQNSSGIYGILNDNDKTTVMFEIQEGGDLYLRLNNNTQTAKKVIREKRWTHVAFIYNNTPGAPGARIYVNGKQVSSSQGSSGLLSVLPPKFHGIGRSCETGSCNFKGTIANIRIYDGTFNPN